MSSTYSFPDSSRHWGPKSTDKILVLMKPLLQVWGTRRKMRSLLKSPEQWRMQLEEMCSFLVRGLAVAPLGVGGPRWRNVERPGLAPRKHAGEVIRGGERRPASRKGPVSSPRGNWHLWPHTPWPRSPGARLSVEEVGCSELGTGKVSVVRGYRASGLRIPH